MKALILCGGIGSRLKPMTHTQAKQLLPVANKPIVYYGIESIVRAGIKEIGIVVGETGDEVRRQIGDGAQWNIRITYIHQNQPLGIAHAVKICKDFLKNDPFVVYLGDNIIKHEISILVKQFCSQNLDALIQLKEVDDPTSFGVAELNDRGNVVQLEEKPKTPKSNLALVGVYLFNTEIHAAINKLQPSGRGEYEITDAIQRLLDAGLKIGSNILTDWWLDTGKKDDLLEANRIVLDEFPDRQEIAPNVQIESKSKISGRLQIATGTQIQNCTIRGPVAIGENCRLQDAYIGPFTAIGNEVEISSSEIEHSIILNGGCIKNLDNRIADSLIGKNAEISKIKSRPEAFRFLLGDDSKVEIL